MSEDILVSSVVLPQSPPVSPFLSQDESLQIQKNLGGFLLESCLSSCVYHPEEQVSYINIARSTSKKNRFLCIECYAQCDEIEKKQVTSLRKFLKKQEHGPIVGDEILAETFPSLQPSELLKLFTNRGSLDREQVEDVPLINAHIAIEKQITSINQQLIDSIQQSVAKVTSIAMEKIAELEHQSQQMLSLITDLHSQKALSIINESRNDVNLMNENINACFEQSYHNAEEISRLNVSYNKLIRSFDSETWKGFQEKVLTLIDQIKLFEDQSSIEVSASIYQQEEMVAESNKSDNNLDLGIQVHEQFNIPQQLNEQSASKNDNTSTSTQNHAHHASCEEEMAEDELQDFLKQALDDKITLNDIRNSNFLKSEQRILVPTNESSDTLTINSNNNYQAIRDNSQGLELSEKEVEEIDDRHFETQFNWRKDQSTWTNFPFTSNNITNIDQVQKQYPNQMNNSEQLANKKRNGSEEIQKGVTVEERQMNQMQQSKHQQLQYQQLSVVRQSSQGEQYPQKQEESCNFTLAECESIIESSTKVQQNSLGLLGSEGERIYFEMKKSKLGSKERITVNHFKNQTIAIESPEDSYMHYLNSKEVFDRNKSYLFLFSLQCSRTDNILIGITPKSQVAEIVLQKTPYYKSFVSTSLSTFQNSCERIERGKRIQLNDGCLHVIMRISLSEGILTFSDFPKMESVNAIKNPNDLKVVNSFYLTVGIIKSKESFSAKEYIPTRLQILDMRSISPLLQQKIIK